MRSLKRQRYTKVSSSVSQRGREHNCFGDCFDHSVHKVTIQSLQFIHAADLAKRNYIYFSNTNMEYFESVALKFDSVNNRFVNIVIIIEFILCIFMVVIFFMIYLNKFIRLGNTYVRYFCKPVHVSVVSLWSDFFKWLLHNM